jgi:hypothetical protein
LAISDVIKTATLPAELAQSIEALTGCVAGSIDAETLRAVLWDVGFTDVRIEPIDGSRDIIRQCMPGAEDYVVSARVEGTKPSGSCCASSCCAE